jgi:ribosomal protein S10
MLLQPEHGPKLIALYETHSSTLNTKGRLSNPFWKEVPESTRFEVVSWLRSERVDKKLWEAYEARAQNAG